MDKQIKLFSVYHKPYIIPKAKYIIPIQAGKALSADSLDMAGDDTDDNISYLNKNFSELTALYCIWKNSDRSEFDIWGLCHYRRYFTKYKLPFWKKKKASYTISATQKNADNLLNNRFQSHLKNIFSKYDIVLPQQAYLGDINENEVYTIKKQYEIYHNPKDWEILMNVVAIKFPEYNKTLNYFYDSPKMSMYNMMITRWEIWDDYLSWLFKILFEVKEKVQISNDIYQQRIFGFMSERLLNLYVYHHNYKVAYLPVLHLND